jgi:hypothetical protein
MARKSPITMGSRADAKKTRNTVLARRLAGNVHGSGSRSVPLKEPGRWQTYIANTYANEDEFYRMRHEKGWEPLMPEDLDCSPEQAGFRVSEDGYLVKGDKGREMVFKMEKDDYRLLMQAKTDRNNAGIGSVSKTREDIANAAATQLGDEAADFLSKQSGQVIDTITGGTAQ